MHGIMFPINVFTKLLKKNTTLNHSNDSLPRECWLNILNYLQNDEEINTLRLVSKEIQHLTTLTEAGKQYYQRKDIFFNTYEKLKPLSQKDNNYARFFDFHLKTQVTRLKEQLTTHSNKFYLTIYFDNSLQSNEEKAYLAQQMGTYGSMLLSSRIHGSSCYNHPTHFFLKKRKNLFYSYFNRITHSIFSGTNSDLNHILLIFTLDATESNRFIQLLVKNKNKHPSSMPFIIIVSLNPLIKLEDFHYPILKLFSISPRPLEKLADAFALNNTHPKLWTNRRYKYYYYSKKMTNIYKEINKLIENLINIKESLQANSDNPFKSP